MTSFDNTIFKHPIILASFVISGLIALGSGWYYFANATPPNTSEVPDPSQSSIVTASGSVEPSQNPNLAFQSGGKVTRISVSVGQTVRHGQLLASLDVNTLSAARAQAAANVKAEQARLDAMRSGARQVDIDAKQTSLDIAAQTLSNDYDTALNTARDDWGKAFGAVHTDSDSAFSNADSASPTLLFQTTNSQTANDLVADRTAIVKDLAAWKQELATLGDTSSRDERKEALNLAQQHLNKLRDYTNLLLEALAGAIPSTTFNSAAIANAYTAGGVLRDTVSSLIASTQAQQQRIVNDTLSVQAAQNALDQIKAPATPEDIETQEARVEAAKAQVAAADAQIGNAIITAPFDGTVASIQVDVGDIVAAGAPAVSLSPQSALQVRAYVSASDVVKIAPGDAATITLDAFGSDRIFPATITAIDHAPTTQQGVPAYRITLQFNNDDPSIGIGMAANITIPLSH